MLPVYYIVMRGGSTETVTVLMSLWGPATAAVFAAAICCLLVCAHIMLIVDAILFWQKNRLALQKKNELQKYFLTDTNLQVNK